MYLNSIHMPALLELRMSLAGVCWFTNFSPCIPFTRGDASACCLQYLLPAIPAAKPCCGPHTTYQRTCLRLHITIASRYDSRPAASRFLLSRLVTHLLYVCISLPHRHAHTLVILCQSYQLSNSSVLPLLTSQHNSPQRLRLLCRALGIR